MIGLKWWQIGLAAALLAGVFFVGRLTAPVEERVVEVEKKVVVEKERVNVTQTLDIEELIREVQKIVRRTNVQRKIVTVETPNGGRTITETEIDRSTTETDTNTDTSTDTAAATEAVVVKEVVKIQERVKLVEKKLDLKWSVAVDVGYYVPALWGDGLQNNLLPGDIILGASVNRKVVGPFSVGIWANTAWGAGLQLRVTW